MSARTQASRRWTDLEVRHGSRSEGESRRQSRKVAEELLDLYARRHVSVGHAFPPDTAWQKELEDSFPYVETEDQARAIMDIKADMERPRPMDRLVVRRRGLRKDRGGAARRVQGRDGRQAGGDSGADHRFGATALRDIFAEAGGLPGARGNALALPHRQGTG